MTLLPTMDQTRKLCEVTFKDVAVGPDALMGQAGAGWVPKEFTPAELAEFDAAAAGGTE